MKHLLLVRHAKSSWDNFSVKDFDRPLNERGKKDAPVMAKRLLKRDIMIDAFISSPAKRARKTAEAFVKEYKGNKEHIIFLDELYLASPSAFEEVIKNINDRYHSTCHFFA